MAHTCTLYRHFEKRVNSTERPTGGESYACRIKHDTDFKNPVLEIAAEFLGNVNYMQFNRDYFYVTSVISHRTGVWEVAGLRDPLATYRDEIKNTEALLLYANAEFDAGSSVYRVPDERIPISRVPAVNMVDTPISGSFTLDPVYGTYFLSCVGESGGVITYIVTQSAMSALISGLGVDIWNKLADYFDVTTPVSSTEDALACIRNGLWAGMSNELCYGSYTDAIKACYWVPFNISAGGQSQRIYLGDYDTGVNGTVYNVKNLTQTFTIPIPWVYDDWRRQNTQIELYLPFCGTVVIPTDKINNEANVYVEMSLDLMTGSLSYRVACGFYTVNVSGSNAGAPYAIGSSNITLQSFMGGASQAVGGGVQVAAGAAAASTGLGAAGGGAAIAGGVTSLANGIMQAVTPQVQSCGSVGGLSAAGLYSRARLVCLYFDPLNMTDFQAEYGHPVHVISKPVDGFNHFRGFSVECAGTPDEIATINNYFNQGAYYV